LTWNWGADRGAARGIALALDRGPEGVTTRASIALPHHDEVSVGIARDRWRELIARRVGVDLEVGADRGAARVVALALDRAPGAVAAQASVALPDHDEVAAGIARGRWKELIARRVAVDLELRSDCRAARGIALSLDGGRIGVAVRAAVAMPDHHEVPARIAPDRRIVLPAVRV